MTKNDFLQKEYEECFKQLRFYDDRHFNLLKYVITLAIFYGIIISAIFGLYQQNLELFFQIQGILSFILVISIFLISMAMIQNRLYFIYPAKQLNEIRRKLTKGIDDFKNQMYTKTNFSSFKIFSSQTIMIVLIYLINSVYFASIFSYLFYLKSISFGEIILIMITFFILQIIFFVVYISLKEKDTADKTIH